MLVKVNNSSFIRDTNSMGLINQNAQEKNEYITKSRLLTHQKKELNNMRQEISDMRSDIDEIKNLLKSIVLATN